MNPLEQYYLNQAGRGINSSSGIGPIYQVPTFVQRGHGIGDILGSLWRFVRPLLWTGVKSLGKQTLRTGGQILTDIANKPANVSAKDIVTAKTRDLVKKLSGGGGGGGRRGRKRKNKTQGGPKQKRQYKRPPIKRDIFS
jgi:hypothetical protein